MASYHPRGNDLLLDAGIMICDKQKRSTSRLRLHSEFGEALQKSSDTKMHSQLSLLLHLTET